MNGPSRYARTEVVAQAATAQAAARRASQIRLLDNARTLAAPRNERYEAQRATTRAGVR